MSEQPHDLGFFGGQPQTLAVALSESLAREQRLREALEIARLAMARRLEDDQRVVEAEEVGWSRPGDAGMRKAVLKAQDALSSVPDGERS